MTTGARSMVLAVVGVLAIAANALGECDCAGVTNKESFKCHRAVFIGIALDGGYFSRVEVQKVFKGKLAKIVEVNSGDGCDLFLTAGQAYLFELYGGEDGSAMKTSICSHTWPLDDPRAVVAVRQLQRRAWWWRLPFSGFCSQR